MQDYNKQLNDIRNAIIKDLIASGGQVLCDIDNIEPYSDEWYNIVHELGVVRTINKYDQLVQFSITKIIDVEGGSIIFEGFNLEDGTTRQFYLKDLALDELLDIYNYTQYQLTN